jgi:type II secretory pathway component PulJ
MKRAERGMSLVEVVVSIVLSTSVLGFLAISVGAMVRANSTSQDHLRTIRGLGQLGERFRRDVHAASSATLAESNGNEALDLALSSGSTVHYRVLPEAVERTVSDGDRTGPPQQFLLPGFKPGIELDQDQNQVELSFRRVARPDSDNSPTVGRFAILAVLKPRPERTGTED